MTTCKRGHPRTPANTTHYGNTIQCKDCRKERSRTIDSIIKKRAYMKQYREQQKTKRPIDGWKASDHTETPPQYLNAIVKPKPAQADWYERSRQQLKQLASHKYAVKAR